VKSRGEKDERSEEAIIPMKGETTELTRREGPLLQTCSARR
jgi:hypothetical protein